VPEAVVTDEFPPLEYISEEYLNTCEGWLKYQAFDLTNLTKDEAAAPSAVKGTEHLGAYGGFGPKAVGAICDPADFTGIFEAPPLVLGPRNGMVTVDLMEPGSSAEPLVHPAEEVARHCFSEAAPHVLVRIFRT
jgi:hypothetical protein